jgi:ribose transport system permease protein
MLRKFFSSESAASIIALVGVVIVFTLINNRFLTRLNIDGIIVSASISAIVGLGMTLIIAMRALDLSVGSIMGFSAISGALLLSHGVPLAFVVAVALGVGGALGFLNSQLINWLRLPSFVATLATLSMILGAELLITDGATVTVRNNMYSKLVIGKLFDIVPWAAVIASAVFLLIWTIFHWTPFGRHIAAIGGDLRAAAGAGINVKAVTTGVFTLSGILAALAGLMVAGMLQNADSTVGVGAELTAIAVVVVGGTSLMGGRGNLVGTVCAAFLLASVKAGLNIANVSSKYEGLVFGGILIIALMADGLRRGASRRGMLVV